MRPCLSLSEPPVFALGCRYLVCYRSSSGFGLGSAVRLRSSEPTGFTSVRHARVLGRTSECANPCYISESSVRRCIKSGPIERQLALRGTRAAGQGSLKELIRRTTNWRERVFLIQWLLFPSPRYLCWVDEIRDSRLLPFHYVYRPIRHLGSYVWSKLRGTIRRAALAQ
jgi:hypothetical protein